MTNCVLFGSLERVHNECVCLVQFNDFYLPFQMMKFECSLAHWKELINPNEGLVQLNDAFA